MWKHTFFRKFAKKFVLLPKLVSIYFCAEFTSRCKEGGMNSGCSSGANPWKKRSSQFCVIFKPLSSVRTKDFWFGRGWNSNIEPVDNQNASCPPLRQKTNLGSGRRGLVPKPVLCHKHSVMSLVCESSVGQHPSPGPWICHCGAVLGEALRETVDFSVLTGTIKCLKRHMFPNYKRSGDFPWQWEQTSQIIFCSLLQRICISQYWSSVWNTRP